MVYLCMAVQYESSMEIFWATSDMSMCSLCNRSLEFWKCEQQV